VANKASILGFRLKVASMLYRGIERKGLTQNQVAEKIGTGKSNLSRTLNGDRNMTLDTLFQIADAIGCRVEVEIVDKSVKQVVPRYNYNSPAIAPIATKNTVAYKLDFKASV
jgi:transcriptional regulator with XRE-family HTH domain